VSSHLRVGACALIAAGALALPAGANAADIQTAVQAVRVHTDRADAALDRAVSLFAKDSDRAARKAFATSRKEMGRATAAATEARSQADTPSETTQAAQAQARLGAELGENIEKFAAALVPADGADENKIAAAVRADTEGHERAIAILTALMGQVPDQAKPGIARAIAGLSQDSEDEIKALGEALASKHVSSANKRRVTEAVSGCPFAGALFGPPSA
jgi:hypothetical protein